MAAFTAQHLLFFNAPKPYNSVKTARYECFLVNRYETYLAWNVRVVKHLHRLVMFTLQAPQNNFVIKAAGKNVIIIFFHTARVFPAQIDYVLRVFTKLPCRYRFKYGQIIGNLVKFICDWFTSHGSLWSLNVMRTSYVLHLFINLRGRSRNFYTPYF